MSALARSVVTAFYPPVVVYVLQFLLEAWFGVYERYYWFDRPMHFLGGVAMAMTGFSLLQIAKKKKWIRIKFLWLEVFLVICFVAFMAVAWEFHEFLLDSFLGSTHQSSVGDTMRDLFLGIIGALTLSVLLHAKSLFSFFD